MPVKNLDAYSDDTSSKQSQIPSIAELFTLLEANKESLKLETYSVSQTTLEQIFLSFAKEQKSEDDQTKK
jgi:hypothetical protein